MTKLAKLQQAAELLQQADALVQQALGAGDKCYAIHNAIQNVAEEVEEEVNWELMLTEEWS